jgi:hypothetical protein
VGRANRQIGKTPFSLQSRCALCYNRVMQNERSLSKAVRGWPLAVSRTGRVPAPSPQVQRQRLARLLSDPAAFSHTLMQPRLHAYQLQPVRAVVDSVIGRRGREFLVVYPRQSGKNEAVAQMLVYLLNLLRFEGGQIVMGATGDALGMAIDRLEQRLDNPWNRGRWTKKRRPSRRCLGNAAIVFLSTHPAASTRGQTAHWLLVVDEAQDQSGPHIEAVFTPMRAAHNATALYIGTVKTTSDFLWQKKREF